MPKKLDLTGKKYGKLTVIKPVPGNSRYLTWECRCDCGNTITATSRDLRFRNKTSCGCAKHGSSLKMDISGHRYGKLTAICPTGEKNPAGSMIWKCRCDCGNETKVAVSELNSGNCKSCGCLKEEYQKLLHERLHLVDGTCVEWLEGRKVRSDNTSGFRGVFKKKNGRYSASIGFKKKIYYIGVFESYQEAVQARLNAEHMIHDSFVEAHQLWESMAQKDPGWAEKNPFEFEVMKVNGTLEVRNSVEKFMKKRVADKAVNPEFSKLTEPAGYNSIFQNLEAENRSETTEKSFPNSHTEEKQREFVSI